jgi:signal transduction histidine kinase
MSIPTHRDFATEVRADRLNMLWKVTLGATAVFGWVAFTAMVTQNGLRPVNIAIIIGVLVSIACGCLLTRLMLSQRRYTLGVWTYAIGGIVAAAIPLTSREPLLIQTVPFVFPLIIFVVGLMLPPSNTFLVVISSAVIIILAPVLSGASETFLSYQLFAIILSLASALLSAQVTGELYQITEWALQNYQRERRTNQELFDNRAQLERALLRSQVLGEKLQETNAELEHARAAAEEAKHFRGQFLANMSHELRTPLNAIIGFSETMLKFPAMYDEVELPKTYENDLNQIYNSGRQLLSLINDILDLSKIDAGKLEIHMEKVELTTVIRSSMSTAAGLIGNKTIRLESDVPEKLPMAWADETRVRQILLNLYSNAAKFTQQGTISLRVREVADGIQFSLQDTGVGIASNNLELIFEEFKQAENVGRDPRSGAGLGLAISRQLVTLMGGRIWAESEVGKGSTFHFVIPTYSPEQEAETEKIIIAEPISNGWSRVKTQKTAQIQRT